MSFSPVLGRRSAVALVWTRSLYSGSMSILMMPRPSLRSTPAMSPTFTPATRTVWPWPATTAWAVENSAFRRLGDAWMNGKRIRSWPRMKAATPAETKISTRIATKSPRCLRIAILIASPPSAAG